MGAHSSNRLARLPRDEGTVPERLLPFRNLHNVVAQRRTACMGFTPRSLQIAGRLNACDTGIGAAVSRSFIIYNPYSTMKNTSTLA